MQKVTVLLMSHKWVLEKRAQLQSPEGLTTRRKAFTRRENFNFIQLDGRCLNGGKCYANSIAGATARQEIRLTGSKLVVEGVVRGRRM